MQKRYCYSAITKNYYVKRSINKSGCQNFAAEAVSVAYANTDVENSKNNYEEKENVNAVNNSPDCVKINEFNIKTTGKGVKEIVINVIKIIRIVYNVIQNCGFVNIVN